MRHPLKKIVMTAAAAATLAVAVPAGSAAALSRTDCGGRTDFTKIHEYNGSNLCFANAGAQNVKIYDVHTVNSGNNRVSVTIGGHTYYLDKYQSIQDVDGTSTTITWIKIW
ncbi:beta/gamma crystallin domain-containing protein [Streptomyces sp. NPDC047022]|uniref:beta/gamma crystallin domain-containing protein n=1 Tax=Streptomyces sp. NPDC047022 TaxID=3155737 RepID=UPI0033F0907F